MFKDFFTFLNYLGGFTTGGKYSFKLLLDSLATQVGLKVNKTDVYIKSINGVEPDNTTKDLIIPPIEEILIPLYSSELNVSQKTYANNTEAIAAGLKHGTLFKVNYNSSTDLFSLATVWIERYFTLAEDAAVLDTYANSIAAYNTPNTDVKTEIETSCGVGTTGSIALRFVVLDFYKNTIIDSATINVSTNTAPDFWNDINNWTDALNNGDLEVSTKEPTKIFLNDKKREFIYLIQKIV